MKEDDWEGKKKKKMTMTMMMGKVNEEEQEDEEEEEKGEVCFSHPLSVQTNLQFAIR